MSNVIEQFLYDKDRRAFIETGKRGTATAALYVLLPKLNVWHIVVASVHYYKENERSMRPFHERYDVYIMYKVVDTNIPFIRGKTVRSLLCDYEPMEFIELDPKDVLSEYFAEFL